MSLMPLRTGASVLVMVAAVQKLEMDAKRNFAAFMSYTRIVDLADRCRAAAQQAIDAADELVDLDAAVAVGVECRTIGDQCPLKRDVDPNQELVHLNATIA